MAEIDQKPAGGEATGASTRARSVLVVEDETGVRDLMCRWLQAAGHAVQTAAGADEALQRLAASPTAVVLCDIRMPGHDGLWLAERIRQRYPETAVIMATGMQDVDAAVDSMRQGAVDYLTKPFGRDRLREAVARGMQWHHTAWEARRWSASLEQEIHVRRTRLGQAIAALQIDSDEAVDAMLSMLTLSDREAYGHAYRVAALALSLARALAVPADHLPAIEHAALLHDIGKLAIPESVLRKPAPLTMDEQALVRQHPIIGSELFLTVPYLAPAVPLIRDASERMDGRGFPRGIKAAQLALGARIISVADAYDTMVRPRAFRDAMPASEALLEMERCKGTQFDASIVEAFRDIVAAQQPALTAVIAV